MLREYTALSNSQGFGTESYLPPEVLKGNVYSFKADIWALGIIFYKMLTNGVHPFNQNNDKDMNLLKEKVKKNDFVISDKITNKIFLKLLKGFISLKTSVIH